MKPSIPIVACDAFAGELDAVAGEINSQGSLNCRVELVYLPQRLHVDFAQIAAAVRQALQPLAGRPAVLLYGSRCHPDWGFLPAQVRRPQEANCIHALTGHSTDEQPRGFFLTPRHLSRWRELFAFDEKTPAQKTAFREKFARYCDHAVLFDTGVGAAGAQELEFFTAGTGLAVTVEKVGLAYFRQLVTRLLLEASGSD